MRAMLIGLAVVALVGGCRRPSSLLLERQARGPIEEEAGIGKGVEWRLEPFEQTKTQAEIEVTVRYASVAFQTEFFANKHVFGPYAGKTPYYRENLVFFIQIANRTQKRIAIMPDSFVLTDDRGNQFSTIGIDYVEALAESRQPITGVARGMIEDARPGYFGFSLPVGRLVASKPITRHALFKLSALQTGVLYPGVIHDGLIAFWTPAVDAKRVKLHVSNVKTDFDAEDMPKTSLDFIFEFEVLTPPSDKAAKSSGS